jgi:hypothetical protein
VIEELAEAFRARKDVSNSSDRASLSCFICVTLVMCRLGTCSILHSIRLPLNGSIVK